MARIFFPSPSSWLCLSCLVRFLLFLLWTFRKEQHLVVLVLVFLWFVLSLFFFQGRGTKHLVCLDPTPTSFLPNSAPHSRSYKHLQHSFNNNNNNNKKMKRQDKDNQDRHSSKRPRGTDEADDATPPSTNEPPPTTTLPPNYGTQSYWEERYQRFLLQQPKTEQPEPSESNPSQQPDDNDNNNDDDQDPLPYHAWYFTYAELRPLLLPLIYGGSGASVPDLPVCWQEDDNDKNEPDQEEEEEEAQDEDHDTEEKDDDYNNDQKEKDDKPQEEQQHSQKDEHDKDDETETNEDDVEENDTDGEEDEYLEEYVEVQEEENEEEEEGEEPVHRGPGLVGGGVPLAILELGCGDVPLGGGLARELHYWSSSLSSSSGLSMQSPSSGPGHDDSSTQKPDSDKAKDDEHSTTPTPLCLDPTVIQRILCTDYSPAVIHQMQREHSSLLLKHQPNATTTTKSCVMESSSAACLETRVDQDHQGHNGGVPNETLSTTGIHGKNNADSNTTEPTGVRLLEFAVLNACDMTSTVSDQSMALILEKGTLDAILSDPHHGSTRCRQVLQECARSLRIGGSMLLISHQNAHTPQGMQWLHDIVLAGLRAHGRSEWRQLQTHQQQQQAKPPDGHTQTHDSSSTPNHSTNTKHHQHTSDLTKNNDTTVWDPSVLPYQWTIEVHGSDQASTLPPPVLESTTTTTTTEQGGDDNDNDESSTDGPGNPGPAVYVIHKEPNNPKDPSKKDTPQPTNNTQDTKTPMSNTNKTKKNGQEDMTIPIRFYSY